MTTRARPHTSGDGVSRAQDQALDSLNAGRTALADGIDSAAARVTAGAEHVSEAARATADRMGASASWLRETSARDVLADFEAIVKAHPGRTLLGAVVLGFVAGRMLRRG